MYTLLVVIHVLICILMVGAILLQSGNVAMAGEWPGLDYPGHFIEVRPTDETTA